MTKKKRDYNRNPNGSNQWEVRSNEEIQLIINQTIHHLKHLTLRMTSPFNKIHYD